MPSFDIIKKSSIQESFRNTSVITSYDLDVQDKLTEHFKGNIQIEGKKWQIGLIVGGSGTGKTTIAKEIFNLDEINELEFTDKSIIDEMPKNRTVSEITKTFNEVGFSSVTSWLKPYHVLSNGEKMRVELAYHLLSDENIIIYDEFTSVVDRTVAQTSSYAISKGIRKNKEKQFIAISCHYDIIDWLEPDWIYNTDSGEFFLFSEEDRPKRPRIELSIFKISRKYGVEIWEKFKKYHYLNTNLPSSAECYICLMNGNLCGFCAVGQVIGKKDMKIISRLVVLPQYQGIGIGTSLLNEISQLYSDSGKIVRIRTSSPSISYSLKKSPKWIFTDKRRVAPHTKMKNANESSSIRRLTFGFTYKDLKE